MCLAHAGAVPPQCRAVCPTLWGLMLCCPEQGRQKERTPLGSAGLALGPASHALCFFLSEVETLVHPPRAGGSLSTGLRSPEGLWGAPLLPDPSSLVWTKEQTWEEVGGMVVRHPQGPPPALPVLWRWLLASEPVSRLKGEDGGGAQVFLSRGQSAF